MDKIHYLWLKRICYKYSSQDINNALKQIKLDIKEENTPGYVWKNKTKLSHDHYWHIRNGLINKYDNSVIIKTINHINKIKYFSEGGK